MNSDLQMVLAIFLTLAVGAMLSGCSVMKGNILESDATVVGINIQAVEWGSLTIGYKSGRVVSVPVSSSNADGDPNAGVPSIKSQKVISSGVTGATITDTLNIGGLE